LQKFVDQVEEGSSSGSQSEPGCGDICKFCLFLISGYNKVTLAFKDKNTLLVILKIARTIIIIISN